MPASSISVAKRPSHPHAHTGPATPTNTSVPTPTTRTLHTQRSLNSRKAWAAEMARSHPPPARLTTVDEAAAPDHGKRTRTAGTAGTAGTSSSNPKASMQPMQPAAPPAMRSLRSPTFDDSDDSERDRTLTNNTPARPHSLFSKLPTKSGFMGALSTTGQPPPQGLSLVTGIPGPKMKNRDRSSSMGRLESPTTGSANSSGTGQSLLGGLGLNHLTLNPVTTATSGATTTSAMPSAPLSAATSSIPQPQPRRGARLSSASSTTSHPGLRIRPSKSPSAAGTEDSGPTSASFANAMNLPFSHAVHQGAPQVVTTSSATGTGFVPALPRTTEESPPVSAVAAPRNGMSRSNSSKASSMNVAFSGYQDYSQPPVTTSSYDLHDPGHHPPDYGAGFDAMMGNHVSQMAQSHSTEAFYAAETERLSANIRHLELELEKERNEREQLTQEASRLLSVEFRRHAEIQRLEDQVDSLGEENRHLQGVVQELRGEREELGRLRTRVQQLEMENERLAKNTTDPEDAARLLDHIEALESENARLTQSQSTSSQQTLSNAASGGVPGGPATPDSKASEEELATLRHRASELESLNTQLTTRAATLHATNLRLTSDRLKFKDDISIKITEMEQEFARVSQRQGREKRDVERKLEEASERLGERTVMCEVAQRRRGELAMALVKVWRVLGEEDDDSGHSRDGEGPEGARAVRVPPELEDEAAYEWNSPRRPNVELPESGVIPLAQDVMRKHQALSTKLCTLEAAHQARSDSLAKLDSLTTQLDAAEKENVELRTRALRSGAHVKVLQTAINDLVAANQLTPSGTGPGAGTGTETVAAGTASPFVLGLEELRELRADKSYNSGTQTPVAVTSPNPGEGSAMPGPPVQVHVQAQGQLQAQVTPSSHTHVPLPSHITPPHPQPRPLPHHVPPHVQPVPADLSALDDETLHMLAGSLAKEDVRALEGAGMGLEGLV